MSRWTDKTGTCLNFPWSGTLLSEINIRKRSDHYPVSPEWCNPSWFYLKTSQASRASLNRDQLKKLSNRSLGTREGSKEDWTNQLGWMSLLLWSESHPGIFCVGLYYLEEPYIPKLKPRKTWTLSRHLNLMGYSACVVGGAQSVNLVTKPRMIHSYMGTFKQCLQDL